MKSSAPASRVQRPLRTGFTTGACSAAAAQAAARCLAQGARLASIESRLPNGQTVNFTLHQSRPTTHGYICSIIKDGGDDPDATHGAELVAHVTLRTDSELIIKGGAGVATVTRPGLGLPVGTSAINPVPRRSIMELVGQELAPLACGAEVEISVPDGLAMATHTLNSRLGLIGGISILGTTGIVRPYSTAAYKASVVQAVDVAADSQAQHLVLTTGGKSETYAMALHPQLPEPAFIQVGDFIGLGLRAAHRRAISQVSIVGMVGKLSKMAGGVMQTHQAGSRVDPEFLATLCAEAGGSLALCAVPVHPDYRGVRELGGQGVFGSFRALANGF